MWKKVEQFKLMYLPKTNGDDLVPYDKASKRSFPRSGASVDIRFPKMVQDIPRGGAALLAAVVTTVALISTYTFYRRKKTSIPTEWRPVAKVKQIFAYPLKSGRRLELENARCTEFGLVVDEWNVELRDRSFVVYGEANNEFKTARTYPKLVLIEASANNNGEVVFSAPGQDQLIVELPSSKQKAIAITLHGKEPCEAVDCGDAAAVWLSSYLLGKPSGMRLGYHKAEYRRDIKRQYSKMFNAYRNLSNDSAGLYSDLTSYHLINQSSIDALNSVLEERITANNFRPNVLVEGENLQAYAEENWDWIKIGDVIFRNVKPCTRCIFTTIDPEGAIFSKTREPLKSLERTNGLKDPSHVQCEGQKGVMGIHLGLYRAGQIRAGDEVSIG